MAGRSFFASADVGRRRLQERLARAPGVIDAVIQGSRVRVVTAAPTPPDVAALASELPGLTLAPTPPRFEDSFVARLRARETPASPRPPRRRAAPCAEPPRSPAEDIIAVQRLTRRFGDFVAVNDVSFRVARGEIFGLLGANGAGKSTTFRMLCGLLPPSGGSLRVAGFDLRTAAAPARGRIGYMAQKFSLYGDLSVRAEPALLQQRLPAVGRAPAATHRLGGRPSSTSLRRSTATARDLPLGFKQRLALACALMHEPDILFLDEPTSGVDPLARREFWRRINALAETGVTVLVTTHFMEEAEYCDRLAIMAQGGVLAAGAPEAIKAAARTAARPDPTMEDAFIAMIEAAARQRRRGAS